MPRVSTKYRLVGVVVHSGTAHAGHYYALLALSGPDAAALDAATGRRDGASSSSSSSSSSAPPADDRRWFKYDDGAVTPWSLADLDQSCFGGRSATKLLAGVDRPYSAYMLFYERVDGTEEEAQAADDGGGLAQMETAPPAPGPPAAWWAPPPAGLATLPIPAALATAGPALLDALLSAHLADVAAARAFDPGLPAFVKGLVERAGAAASRKPRRLSSVTEEWVTPGSTTPLPPPPQQAGGGR